MNVTLRLDWQRATRGRAMVRITPDGGGGGGAVRSAFPIETGVDGKPAECEAVAGWLEDLADAATCAADDALKAETTADSGWEGPAGDAFLVVAKEPRIRCDNLAYTCRENARELRDFAEGLRKVREKMDDVRDKAVGGGLDVDGSRILAPIYPNEPVPPADGCSLIEMNEYRQAVADYNSGPLVDYNDKAEVFNGCVDDSADAREYEGKVYASLMGEVKLSLPAEIDWSDAVTVTVSATAIDEAGKRTYTEPGRHAGKASLWIKGARLWRMVPYASILTTAGLELNSAAQGDQSFARAGVKTAAILVAGLLGGAVAGPAGSVAASLIATYLVNDDGHGPDPHAPILQQAAVQYVYCGEETTP